MPNTSQALNRRLIVAVVSSSIKIMIMNAALKDSEKCIWVRESVEHVEKHGRLLFSISLETVL